MIFLGWWFVQNGDRTGFVPGAFLKRSDSQRDEHDMTTSIQSSRMCREYFSIELCILSFVDEPYVVNRSYEAKSTDEISLLQGSFVTVLEKSYTGWWLVKYDSF